MDMITLSLAFVLTLALVLVTGIWIPMAMICAALVTMWLSSPASAGDVMATVVWGGATNWTLAALPLFIWMGEILFRTRLSEQMFEGLAPLVDRIPGRLLHVNVLGSGIFAAACGSTAATVATIGRISLPELAKRGYSRRMSVGSLVTAGTLGIMIPPSITFIVYGAAAEISVARLFIAGVFPGIILMILMSGFIVLWALVTKPKLKVDESMTLRNSLRSPGGLVSVVFLIVAVIGSIYWGIATPTEAAGVGVIGALIISAASGTLSWSTFVDSVRGATRTSCMIGFIVAGAVFMTAAMGYAGIPRWIASVVAESGLSPYQLIAVLTLIFILLGCFLDGISIIMLATSLLIPTVTQAGFDLIWFGVFLVLVVEMSMVTPPIGLNLFVAQGLTNLGIGEISFSALPFFLILVGFVVILVAFPELATYLPSHMKFH